jgi:hypothetical protein
VRGGVDQTEDGVRAGPAGGVTGLWLQSRQHAHPHFDVAALQPAHLGRVGIGEGAEVAVLHRDEGGVVECELDLEVDQPAQLGGGVGAGGGHPGGAAGQQPLADPQQHLGQHRVLAREVPVDGRPGHPDGRPDVVDPDRARATFGEQLGGGLQDLLPSGGPFRIGVQSRILLGPRRRHARDGSAGVNRR